MSLEAGLIVVASLLLLVILLGFITLNRFLAYKERIALARLGYSADDLGSAVDSGRRGSRGALWGGVITMMSGFALLLGLSPLGSGVWLIAGLLPMFVGLGMVLIYFTASSSPARPPAEAPERAEDPFASSPGGDDESTARAQ